MKCEDGKMNDTNTEKIVDVLTEIRQSIDGLSSSVENVRKEISDLDTTIKNSFTNLSDEINNK